MLAYAGMAVNAVVNAEHERTLVCCNSPMT